jgi:putative ABC transport system permease protein
MPSWMDLRYAFRGLPTARGTTAVAILCLTLGIGATALMLSVIDAAVWRPLPCPSPDRLVAVLEKHPQRGLMAVRPAAYFDWRDRAWWFERSAPQLDTSFVMAGQDRHVDGRLAGEGFLETWGVAPRLGRGFDAADYRQPNAPDASIGRRGGVVILSDAFWQRQFGGGAGVLGRTLVLDGAAYTIVGVMPPSFHVIDRSDLFVPWILSAEDRAERRFHLLPTVARLKPTVSRAEAQREMQSLYRQLGAQFPESAEWSVDLIPPRDLLLGSVPSVLAMLLGAVCLVLLIACANVSNLLLARGLSRRREMALRLALGCSPARLIAQHFAEGAMLTFSGAACGLALAAVGVRIIASLPVIATMPLAFEPALDARVLAFTCAIAAISVLLFATIPAWSSARTDVIDALPTVHAGGSAASRHTARSVLVIGEVALAVIVAVLTMMMVQSVMRLQQVHPGVRTDGVLTLALEASPQRHPTYDELPRYYEELLTRVRALPGVRTAAVSSQVPLTEPGRNWRFSIEGRPTTNTDQYSAIPSVVSREIFATLDIARVAGRLFEASDRADTAPVVVLSQAAVRRYWPHDNPLGQHIRIAGIDRPFAIVGIVGDVSQRTLDVDPAPALYVMQDQFPDRWITLFVRTDGDPARLTESVRQAIHAVDAGQPIDRVQSMETIRRTALGEPRFRASMLACFAGLAFLLAAVGIYGVMSQIVGERRHEIGVRIALGARGREVIAHIARHALMLTAVGLTTGLCAAAALARVVRGLLFGVAPTDLTSFVAAAVVFLAIAAAASWLPARRATRIDPMLVLKQH